MSATEQHYTVPQVAKMWAKSTRTIIRYFENESGVLKFGKGETRFKRRRIVLSIPESVLRRVHARLCAHPGVPTNSARSKA
jgi:hypothetical protein